MSFTFEVFLNALVEVGNALLSGAFEEECVVLAVCFFQIYHIGDLTLGILIVRDVGKPHEVVDNVRIIWFLVVVFDSSLLQHLQTFLNKLTGIVSLVRVVSVVLSIGHP